MAVLVSFLCACGVNGGCGGMEALPWMALAGTGSAKPLGDVCRFADLQQLHEFTQVIEGAFTRVLRAMDEGFENLPNLPIFM